MILGDGILGRAGPFMPGVPAQSGLVQNTPESRGSHRRQQASENPPYGVPRSAHDRGQCDWAAVPELPDGQDFLGPQCRIEVRTFSAGVLPDCRPPTARPSSPRRFPPRRVDSASRGRFYGTLT
jgi:hypothetical protein